MDAVDLARLRRWMLATGIGMAIVLGVQLFVLDALLDAAHRGGAIGPFDFPTRAPKRSLEATQTKAAWIVAGVLLNGGLSWGFAAATLCPRRLATRWLPFIQRRRPLGIAFGLAAAALGVAQFSFASAGAALWIAVVFAGFVLAGAALGCATTSAFARVVAGAAVATLAGITLPSLIAAPASLDLVYAEDMAFEMLQAQLFACSALLLFRARALAGGTARHVLLLGALGFIFLAGEELSWGQRILGFDTPEFWLNSQNETTIHNIPALDAWLNFRPALLAWALLSGLAALAPRLRRALERLAIAVVPVAAWPAMAAALLVHNSTLHAWYRNTDEVQETLAAIAFASAAFASYYGRAGLLGETRSD